MRECGSAGPKKYGIVMDAEVAPDVRRSLARIYGRGADGRRGGRRGFDVNK